MGKRAKGNRYPRVIIDDAIHRVFALERVHSGVPVQAQVNSILRDYCRRRGLLKNEAAKGVEQAAAS